MEEFAIGSIVLSLLMTIGWTILNLPRKLLSWVSLLLMAVILAIISGTLVTNSGSVQFILAETLFYPLICLWIFFFSSVIFYFFDIKGREIIFLIIFAGSLLLLMYGFEMVKISVNTWKSVFPAIAFLQVLSAFLTLQAITCLSAAKTNFGVLKLITGIVSFAVIFLQYLKLLPSIKSDADIFYSNIVLFGSAVLIVEGLLIIYKAKKESAQKEV